MKIKDLCASERPRERLLANGASTLSNSELLAVLIRGGGGDDSALDISNRLLSMCDGQLSNLFNMPLEKICSVPWVGPCKAASIAAAFELGKRFLTEESSVIRKPLITASSVYEIMFPALKGLRHEECWVLFLNSSNFLTGKTMVTSGGGNATVIDVRQIVRMALEKCATAMILVHNHPSGNPHPSEADIRETDSLREAAQTCRIALLDHVIVADGSFFSFADNRVYKG